MNKKIILMCLLVVGLGIMGFVTWRFLGNKAQNTPQKMALTSETNTQPNQPSADSQQSNNVQSDEFSNKQKYKVFTAADFEVKYPYWQNMDLRGASNAENIKLAVTDRGCVFMIKISPIPADTTFKTYAEKLLQNQEVSLSIKTLTKDISENQLHFEGELVVSGVVVKNVSYSYLTDKNQAAGFAFVADKNKFAEVCQPIVSEVVKSVVIK